MSPPRILVAGVGNIFLGDDAFGVEVVRELSRQSIPEDVRVVDFGIRGLDLTYALLDGYETVVIVDAMTRGGVPGTLYRLEVDPGEAGAPEIPSGGHNLDPAQVLRLAAAMGGKVQRLLVVACEPTPLSEEDVAMGLSAPVQVAVGTGVTMILSLLSELRRSREGEVLTNKGVDHVELRTGGTARSI